MAGTAIYVQADCYLHRYVRGKEDSTIVERPERLRSVSLGLAAALARLEQIGEAEEANAVKNPATLTNFTDPPDARSPNDLNSDLTDALNRLTIEPSLKTSEYPKPASKCRLIQSSARVPLLQDPAVKYIHGDIDGPGYIHNFVQWASQSEEKLAEGKSEIPEGLHQLDLYLCAQSQEAVSGALGTICEAVDGIMKGTERLDVQSKTENASSLNATFNPAQAIERAFVAIRPPGHHCGEDSPSGFCFVNNVMVAAAHAHLMHRVNRVVVFDIDLHHGNGTQSIVWSINEEAFRAAEVNSVLPHPESSEGLSSEKEGSSPLKVFYGSIHDVLSFPCEEGKPELIQAASTTLRGPHGQWIENIHLLPYENDEEFYEKLYPKYLTLIQRAEDFLEVEGKTEETLVFISCGFDASLHEYDYMSRHGRKVPTSFYYRFTAAVNKFAAKYAKKRVISVLEGGYSQRALCSGAFAHLVGLASWETSSVDEEWWNMDNLLKLEKIAKPKSRRSSGTPRMDPWLDRAAALLPLLDVAPPKAPRSRQHFAVSPLAERMTLRERKKPETSPSKAKSEVPDRPQSERRVAPKSSNGQSQSTNGSADENPSQVSAPKKMPKVILHVNPKTEPKG